MLVPIPAAWICTSTEEQEQPLSTFPCEQTVAIQMFA